MKLRQLVFNSLPRPKSKHKRKSQEQKQQTPESPESPNPEAARPEDRPSEKPAEPSKRDGVTRPHVLKLQISSHEENTGKIAGSTPVEGNDKVTGMKAGVAIESADLNLNTESTKCACYKHLHPLGGSSASSPEEECHERGLPTSDTPSLSPSTSSAEDSGFISLPKTRTRIKTNPWLPSPRSSAATSPDISPTSSSTPSPVYTDRHNFHPFPKVIAEKPHQGKPKKRRRYKAGNDTMTTPLNIPVTQPAEAPIQNSMKSTEDSNSILQCSFLSESDNCGPESGLQSLETSLCSETNSLGKPNDNCGYLAHCFDTGSVQTSCTGLDEEGVEQVIRGDLIETQVSFEYEEAFESQLEVKGVGEYVGSKDELSDDSCEHLFNDPLGSRAHDFDSEYCPSVYDSSPVTDYNSETETDDTVCDDYYTATGFRGHGRPGPFNDLFRNYYQSDGDSEQDMSDDNEVALDTFSEFPNNSRKRVYTRQTGVQSGRGIHQLQVSLQRQLEHLSIGQEVGRLQQEQIIVDQHLLEAREAERLRREERRRLKKEVNMHRKRLLLRTLQELRSKLEDQSRRLQQTYSAVLGMQQAIICDRRQQPQLPPPVDTREAPF